MAKPQQTTDIDDARRIIGMLKIVTYPREYMEIFNITVEDIKIYKLMVQEHKKTLKIPTFNEE